jgi:phosphomevalonate kinase
MRITASAPGKLVLSGEYAVLDGAPAICVAVDRGIHDRDRPLPSG